MHTSNVELKKHFMYNLGTFAMDIANLVFISPSAPMGTLQGLLYTRNLIFKHFSMLKIFLAQMGEVFAFAVF